MSWSEAPDRAGRRLARRRVLRAGVAVAAAAVMAPGCGFRPLYGQRPDGSTTTDRLSVIAITNIRDRRGQQLRNLLIDRFYADGRPAQALYRLDVVLDSYEAKIGVQKDASAVRSQLTIAATYNLVNMADGRSLQQGVSRSLISYNILDDQYATWSSLNDAYQRGLEQIAEDLTVRSALVLDRGA
jgi:LPS-assembly lipoprotein